MAHAFRWIILLPVVMLATAFGYFGPLSFVCKYAVACSNDSFVAIPAYTFWQGVALNLGALLGGALAALFGLPVCVNIAPTRKWYAAISLFIAGVLLMIVIGLQTRIYVGIVSFLALGIYMLVLYRSEPYVYSPPDKSLKRTREENRRQCE